MLSEHDFKLLHKNQSHYCRGFVIYFSLSRGWEIYNSSKQLVLRENISYCPFCSQELGVK